MRRSGIGLVLMGLLGGLFFWLSDPRLGWIGRLRGDGIVDAANQSLPGTMVGLLGSGIVLAMGLWLLVRRRV